MINYIPQIPVRATVNGLAVTFAENAGNIDFTVTSGDMTISGVTSELLEDKVNSLTPLPGAEVHFNILLAKENTTEDIDILILCSSSHSQVFEQLSNTNYSAIESLGNGHIDAGSADVENVQINIISW